MKIVNKRKFIRSIGLILVLIIMLVMFGATKTFSHVEVKEKKISVSNGETLWGIAKTESKGNEYYKNKDVRDIVENIKHLNNLPNSNIYEGQELVIYTY